MKVNEKRDDNTREGRVPKLQHDVKLKRHAFIPPLRPITPKSMQHHLWMSHHSSSDLTWVTFEELWPIDGNRFINIPILRHIGRVVIRVGRPFSHPRTTYV